MVHPQSRALIESFSPTAGTALVAQYEHPSALRSGSQGNVQNLANGDVFVGWGAEPYFSEFSAPGTLLYDAHFHGTYQAYRGYRFAMDRRPRRAPGRACEHRCREADGVRELERRHPDRDLAAARRAHAVEPRPGRERPARGLRDRPARARRRRPTSRCRRSTRAEP